jgi:hypothetical protein
MRDLTNDELQHVYGAGSYGPVMNGKKRRKHGTSSGRKNRGSSSGHKTSSGGKRKKKFVCKPYGAPA